MKGAQFLAMFLILAGIVLIVMAIRGRAGALRQVFGQ